MDYCLFCGEKVTDWRNHMLKKHRAVLAESPKYDDGKWKPFSENVLQEEI